jgi:hypothetical protein
MKSFRCAASIVVTLAASAAFAQSPVPDTPPLTPAQAQDVQRELDAYRQDVALRQAQGNVTAEEAQRLIMWRQYQLALQVTGTATPSQIIERQAQADSERMAVTSAYGYYPGIAPLLGAIWMLRPTVCAASAGHNWGGSVCF